MKIRKTTIVVLVALAFLGIASAAAASMLIPAADQTKEKAKAPLNSPVINENWELERIDFIHYVKPESPAKAPKTPSCYKLLGPKWKSLPVDYVINPKFTSEKNPAGLDESFVESAVLTSAETWDEAIKVELFDTYTVDYNVAYGIQDFVNAIAFGDYPDNRVIAVTTIWWSPRLRQIVEFDIMFDTDWAWGDANATATTDSKDPTAVMDLQSIATHELGHGAGLADVYDETCSAVTMFGYSNYEETQKRSLEQPDITGIQKLYGE